MDVQSSSSFLTFSVIVHLSGIVLLILSRASEGSPHHKLCFRFFLVCLVLAAISTMLSLRSVSGMGLYYGFALGLMIVGATCEFQQVRPVSPRHAFTE